MASIFTFDPDPPRVSSPWSISARQSPRLENEAHLLEQSRAALSEDFEELQLGQMDDLHVTRLDAEPQEGPTEYKLHLLLRPRRSVSAATTPKNAPSSQRSHSPAAASPRAQVHMSLQSTPPLASSSGSRQHRLEQLTTQLLWRLQQSSPHHSSSATNVILPSIPVASAVLSPPQQPGKLVPGLEESKGALYEIGVSDDGTFVGLTKDEMAESLNNLRAMAASLGCSVQVLRMVPISEYERLEKDKSSDASLHGRLYVAEAYVKPELKTSREATSDSTGLATGQSGSSWTQPAAHDVTTEQLRVSITGATTSGKSTLLGTLSTSTLDNGRGKSRLSLLKHRHEIVSGMTSSVAQELIGYRDAPGSCPIQVINYGANDVVSWNDVHAASDPGRLVLLSDSAGHPRYRRTTVRGLVGWAPQWTILCVAANGGSDLPAFTDPTFSGASAHLSMAHLDLCIRLQLPLLVVITKLDAANKTTFRQILSSLLSILKANGRRPVILPNDKGVSEDSELQTVSEGDASGVKEVVDALKNDPLTTVPIVFTSSVKGNGIGKLHSLLRHLPIPQHESEPLSDAEPPVLFHVNDNFNLPAAAAATLSSTAGLDTHPASTGSIVSGLLRHGTITIGDDLLLGPFPHTGTTSASSTAHDWLPPPSQPDDPFLTPRSFTDALAEATSSPRVSPALGVAHPREWLHVRVISTRNLRLPVRALHEGQVSTVGLVFLDRADGDGNEPAARPEVRKGMVLLRAGAETCAAHSFTASFALEDAASVVVGSHVVVYCASVRESAKVVAVALQDSPPASASASAGPGGVRAGNAVGGESGDDLDDAGTFAFDWDGDGNEAQSDGGEGGEAQVARILVTFQFTAYRAWLEGGVMVLVMPGGGGGLEFASAGSVERGVRGFAGFDGFVGTVVDTFG